MEDVLRTLGARVRELRKAQALTQEDLAEKADMHWTFISGVERGIKDPRITTIARIAGALGVTADDLLRPAAGQRSRRHR